MKPVEYTFKITLMAVLLTLHSTMATENMNTTTLDNILHAITRIDQTLQNTLLKITTIERNQQALASKLDHVAQDVRKDKGHDIGHRVPHTSIVQRYPKNIQTHRRSEILYHQGQRCHHR